MAISVDNGMCATYIAIEFQVLLGAASAIMLEICIILVGCAMPLLSLMLYRDRGVILKAAFFDATFSRQFRLLLFAASSYGFLLDSYYEKHMKKILRVKAEVYVSPSTGGVSRGQAAFSLEVYPRANDPGESSTLRFIRRSS